MSLLILIPSCLGFGTKFLEFIAIFSGEVDGAFAIAPILNYLLASFGFLMLFLWATVNGMFHNIEGPKHDLLRNEAAIDRGRQTAETFAPHRTDDSEY